MSAPKLTRLNVVWAKIGQYMFLKSIVKTTTFPQAAELLTSAKEPTARDIYVENYKREDIREVLYKDKNYLMNMYAIGAHAGISAPCMMVEGMAKAVGLPFDGLRFIQINKDGKSLLRIFKNGNEEMDRAALVDIDKYLKCCATAFIRKSGWLISLIVAGYVLM